MTTESTLTIALNEARAEITRLLGIIAARDEWACKAHERIAELEEENQGYKDHAYIFIDCPECGYEFMPSVMSKLYPTIGAFERLGCHIITDAQLASGEVVLLTQGQIDAAWAYANDPVLRPFTRKGAELALKELGIERCEKCCGTGRPEYPLEGNYGPCPDCNGRGWIKT